MTDAEIERWARENGGTVGPSVAESMPRDFDFPATIRPAPDISEKDFQAMVITYAESRGWKVYHTYLSIRSKAGYPDLTMVRRNDVDSGRVVFAELKTEAGKVEKAQSEWLKALEQAGQEVYLWRPSNWPEIQRLLQ